MSPAQTNQGTASGTTFTASLPNAPATGNSILVVVGLDHSASVDADDTAHVILAAETASAFGVSGAPYALLFAAGADPAVTTWGFHLGTSQKVTWLAAELPAVQKFESGVPKWDGAPFSSAYLVNGSATTLSTGHGQQTVNAHELLIASFADRVTSGTPPTVTGFANTTGGQAGTWARLGATVASTGTGANHRLDVAWKSVTVTGTYDCTATWSAAPAGMSGMVTGFYAV
jgi:hypothetical protein